MQPGVIIHTDNVDEIRKIFEERFLKIDKSSDFKITENYSYFIRTPDQNPKKYDATGYMDNLKEFILESKASDFEENIESMFDMDNVIDWQIMIMLSNNGDAVYKNFYLYRESKKSKFKIALWDYDSGFGRDTDNELNLMKTTSHWERNSLLDRLYNQDVNNYQERLHSRWAILRETGKISVEEFESRIDKLASQLEPFVARNFERWPVTASYYWDKYTWEQEIGILKEFINLRIPQLDKKFKYNGR